MKNILKCKCGCGRKINNFKKRYFSKYIQGHFFRNKKFSKKHRLSFKKRWKKNHSLFWIKFQCPICCKKFERRKCSVKQRPRIKIRYCSRKCYDKAYVNKTAVLSDVRGEKNPMYGKKHKKSTLKLISKTSKGRWFGRKHTIKTRIKMSKTRKELLYALGENSVHRLYDNEFNHILKSFIRKRDQYRCQNQECGVPEKELFRNLDIHHIDYNKKNNNTVNLISLCNHCHGKTIRNRKYWKEYYENIQIKRKVHELDIYNEQSWRVK